MLYACFARKFNLLSRKSNKTADQTNMTRKEKKRLEIDEVPTGGHGGPDLHWHG
jgi:hypothetical protein